MKNLNKLFNECRNELDEIHIPYRYIGVPCISNNMTHTLGQCKICGPDSFTLTFSHSILDDNIPDKIVKSIIAHEILHSINGCFNHGSKWKHYAEIVSTAYGYDIKRTMDLEKLGISIPEKPPLHKFVCKGCGSVITRTRESKFTKGYERFTCAKCHSKFEKIF